MRTRRIKSWLINYRTRMRIYWLKLNDEYTITYYHILKILTMFQIKGNFSYHLEVLCPTLNDSSTLTINAFTDKSARIPIGCKYQWHKKLDNDKIKLEASGNIYQCSVFDIGYSLEATITSFEEGSEGQATVEFNKI